VLVLVVLFPRHTWREQQFVVLKRQGLRVELLRALLDRSRQQRWSIDDRVHAR
jgi:hypothetical protein